MMVYLFTGLEELQTRGEETVLVVCAGVQTSDGLGQLGLVMETRRGGQTLQPRKQIVDEQTLAVAEVRTREFKRWEMGILPHGL